MPVTSTGMTIRLHSVDLALPSAELVEARTPSPFDELRAVAENRKASHKFSGRNILLKLTSRPDTMNCPSPR
jgi:hypothetical protein